MEQFHGKLCHTGQQHPSSQKKDSDFAMSQRFKTSSILRYQIEKSLEDYAINMDVRGQRPPEPPEGRRLRRIQSLIIRTRPEKSIGTNPYNLKSQHIQKESKSSEGEILELQEESDSYSSTEYESREEGKRTCEGCINVLIKDQEILLEVVEKVQDPEVQQKIVQRLRDAMTISKPPER